MPYADRTKRLEYARRWNKKYYRENTDKEKRRIAKRKETIGKWLVEYKTTLFCQKCGETTPVYLDFHHQGEKGKDLTLANAKSWGWSIKRIKQEISKCVVLCANCHRKAHISNNAG